MSRILSGLFVCWLLAWCAAITAADPVPRGSRVLSIDVNQSQSGDYNAAWAIAETCGIQNIGLSLDWNQFESGAAGVFADPNGWLTAANAFYPAQGATLTLTLRPLHNSVKPVPTDLVNTPFDNASDTMSTRFCALLDWVIPRLPDVTVEALVIGSEYDVALTTEQEWTDYYNFLSQVISHIRASSYSGRIPRIAAEATFDGYVNEAIGVGAINSLCDVAGVSYYAIGAGFAVKNHTQVRADLDSLLSFASAGKPLCFYQFGCPSSWRDSGGTLHDRSAEQAAFIRTTFAFWDANPTTVRLMDFTWLHDMSPAELAIQEAYFGLSDPAFLTFLGSLGMRSYGGAGAAKSAWTALREETYARGWGDPIPPGGSGGGSSSGGGGGGGCGAGGGIAGLLMLSALGTLSFTTRRHRG